MATSRHAPPKFEAVLPRDADWRTLVAPAAPRPEVLQQA